MFLLSLLFACGPAPEPAAEAPTVAMTDADADAGADAMPPCHHADPLAAEAATEGSIYDLKLDLVDQHGQAATLDLDRGHPTLVTMFYGSCTQVCPMIVAKMQSVEASLDPAARADLRVLLVSLDPERDTPEVLQAMAERHGVDADRWTFATTSPDGVRDLAAVLGIQWRKDPGGEIRHSTVITLVDGQGVPVERIEGLNAPREKLVKAASGLSSS